MKVVCVIDGYISPPGTIAPLRQLGRGRKLTRSSQNERITSVMRKLRAFRYLIVRSSTCRDKRSTEILHESNSKIIRRTFYKKINRKKCSLVGPE